MGIGWGDLGYAVPGYNVYKLGQDAKGAYEDYKNSAKAPYQWAEGQYQQGQAGSQNYLQQGLDKSIGAYAPAQQVNQQQQGYFNSPGYLEQLYKQRQTGTDPYYNYMTSQLNNQNFNQMSARGLNNSTYAQQTGNLAQQGLIAQQSQAMAGLAGGASQEQAARMQGQWGEQMGLSNAQAGIFSQYYPQMTQNYNDWNKNRIAAGAGARGVDADTTRAFASGFTDLAKAGGAAGAKALAGGA